MTENKNQKPILPDKPCTVTAFLLESNIMGSVIGKKETNLIISCNLGLIQGVMVFNATFNNIKDIK
jgi:hypothetical protein